MATVIRGDDNFDTSSPAFGRVVRTSGTISTTSTSLVDITGASITITTGANPIAYGAVQSSRHGTKSEYMRFNIDIDGTLQLGTDGLTDASADINYLQNTSFSGVSAAVTAGSHTIKEQWKTNTGTAYLYMSSSISHLFYAYEVK